MSSLSAPSMTKQQMRDYVSERARAIAFDAVYALWQKRHAEGRMKSALADTLGKNNSWVSRSLKGPANWTIKTLAELTYALDGDLEIIVRPLEDIKKTRRNYDIYSEYELPVNSIQNTDSSSSSISFLDRMNDLNAGRI